jgi:hypothetical protein
VGVGGDAAGCLRFLRPLEMAKGVLTGGQLL